MSRRYPSPDTPSRKRTSSKGRSSSLPEYQARRDAPQREPKAAPRTRKFDTSNLDKQRHSVKQKPDGGTSRQKAVGTTSRQPALSETGRQRTLGSTSGHEVLAETGRQKSLGTTSRQRKLGETGRQNLSETGRQNLGGTSRQRVVGETGRQQGLGETSRQKSLGSTRGNPALTGSQTASGKRVGGETGAGTGAINRTGSLNKTGSLNQTGTSRRLTASHERVQSTSSLAKVDNGQVRAVRKQVNAPQQRGSVERGFVPFYKRHLKVMLPITLVIAFFLGFGVYDFVSCWGKIHPGVSVQGVDVGGMTVEDAGKKISTQLDAVLQTSKITAYENNAIADAPKDAEADDATADSGIEQAQAAEGDGADVNDDGKVSKWKINANTIGAYADGVSLAEKAYGVGRSGNFIGERVHAWLSGEDIPATISCNPELFNTLVMTIDEKIGTSIKNSKAEIEDGVATLAEGHDGVEVDKTALLDNLSAVAFKGGKTKCVVPLYRITRNVSDQTAQRIVDQINGAISQNVTITYENESWTMKADDLGDVVSQKVLKPDEVLVIANGTQDVKKNSEAEAAYDVSTGVDENSGYILQPYVNQRLMDKYLVKILGDKALGGAKNARFDTSSGKVVIKPSKQGKGPDRAAAELELQDILFGTSTTARTIALVDTIIEPELTTEEAKGMGIKERLARWSIPLSGSEGRIHNIKLLCKLINKSLVKPGDTWSFNDTTGERTQEKGFKTAPVIIGGRHEDQLGGGICQVATCVFNCACFSGLGIGTRANHAFYIPAYDDEGFADATVSWEVPDLQWVNDTKNYVLLTASAKDGAVTVSFWGTDEGRKVTCDRGKWKKGAKYKTIRENDDELPVGTTKVEQSGTDGRSIYIRYIAKDKSGKVLHDINFHSVYSAQNEIIKIGTKGASSSSSDSDESDSDEESDS